MATDQSGLLNDSGRSRRSADRQDRNAAAAAGNHRGILLLSLVILAGSVALRCTDDGRVRIPLLSRAVPEVCLWRMYTGVDCPGCGLTRCFVCLAHGRLQDAVRYHPVGVGLFVFVVAQLPFRWMQLRRLARGQEQWKHPLLGAVVWLAIVGLLAWWLLKTFQVVWIRGGF